MTNRVLICSNISLSLCLSVSVSVYIFKCCTFLPNFLNILPFFWTFSENSHTCLYFLERAPYNIYVYVNIYICNIYVYVNIYIYNIYVYIYIYIIYIYIYIYIYKTKTFSNSIGTRWYWIVNAKRKFWTFVKSWAHTCNSHTHFLTKRTFQSWCSWGWLTITLSFFPTLHPSSQPFIHLFLSPFSRLRPFSSLLLSMSLIAKALKDSHNFSLTFQILIFLHTTKNWKDNRLLLTYLLSKFQLHKTR